MKRTLIINIFLLMIPLTVFSKDYKDRNIGFNYFKKGVDTVELVGSFGKNNTLVYLHMLQISEYQWSLTLKIKSGFYYYRYLLNKKQWCMDEYIKDEIEISTGLVQGKYSLLKVFPIDHKEAVVLAGKYQQTGKYEWAREILINTIKKFPDRISLYRNLGNIYKENGYYGFAVDTFLAALERDPEQHELRYSLALCYERLYKQEEKKIYKNKADIHWKKLFRVRKYRKEISRYLKGELK